MARPPDRPEVTVLTWITAEPVSHTEAGTSKQTDSQIHQWTDIGVSSSSAEACGLRSSSIRLRGRTLHSHHPLLSSSSSSYHI
ncbi:hypothetical protein PAMP_009504 [Pampus punctatissimus]